MKDRPELSRRVAAADIGAEPVTLDIASSEAERRALAKRFGLLALDRFSGRARLARAGARDGSGPVVRVDFAFEAAVVQSCVVTLEPVAACVGETGLVAEFAEVAAPSAADMAPDGVDPPEPLTDGLVDVGELLAQHLGLALAPYPRAPDVEFTSSAGSAERRRPFAALAGLLREREGE